MMELNLIQRGLESLGSDRLLSEKQTLHHRRAGLGDKSGLICAGSQTNLYVLCMPETHGTVARQIAEIADRDESAMLIITAALFEVVACSFDAAAASVTLTQHEDDWRYEEQLLNRKRIAIVGGGHCGRALSQSMAGIGYTVSVFDTRADVETFVNNPFATHKVEVADYSEVGARITIPECTRVVVMTTDYLSDVIALKGTLRYPFPFVGVMGSAAKIEQIEADLAEAGFRENDLSKLYAPIGLKIHSHTPEEIAISIAAQLISLQG